MRRIVLAASISSLTALAFFVGCSIDTAGTADEVADGSPVDDTLSGDTLFPTEETSPDDTSVDSVVDSGGDDTLDTSTPDTSDTAVPDTFVPDTFVPDTFVPDTFVPDTFVPDTFMPDTADTSVADTFVPDTFVPDTSAPDTSAVDSADAAPETPLVGLLTGSGVNGPTSGTINLTADGTLDWAHWGNGTVTAFNHKNGSDLISQGTAGASVGRYSSYPISFSWTNGTPTASATTNDGIYLTAKDEQFVFSVNADVVSTRTLKLYTAWYSPGTTGKIDVALSDGSASGWSGSIPPAPSPMTVGAVPATFTFQFRAVTAGAKLNITITKTSAGSGLATTYLSLLAASLTTP